jgi:RNA polymerase sigma-70 factor, ECF subfamily
MDKAFRLEVVKPPGGETLAEQSDDDLMLLARAGAPGAFDTLIRRHQPRMLRLSYRYLGDASLAADAAQNAFVALFRTLPSYRAQGKFSSYLYRLLLNQCRMTKRSRRAEQKALDVVSSWEERNVAETLQRERQREVEVAVGELSVKLREVVLLRYGAGLEYGDIAETLDIPLGTVKRRMFDAMAKLREVLGEA